MKAIIVKYKRSFIYVIKLKESDMELLTHTYIHTYIHTYTHTHTHIHTYTHTHTHTHICTYIHTYINKILRLKINQTVLELDF